MICKRSDNYLLFRLASRDSFLFILKCVTIIIISIAKIRNKKIKFILNTDEVGYLNKLHMKGNIKMIGHTKDTIDIKYPNSTADFSSFFNDRRAFNKDKPKTTHIINPIKKTLEQQTLILSLVLKIKIAPMIRYIEYAKNTPLKIRNNVPYFSSVFWFPFVINFFSEKYYFIGINSFGDIGKD